MSYGIEIRNSDGNLVLDEENEVVLVSEKGTISGTRNDYPVEGVYGDYNHLWYRDTFDNMAYSCVHLTQAYADPPIVAIRGQSGAYNILLPGVVQFASGDNGTSIDRLYFRSDFPRSIDYIVCCGASDATAAGKAVGSDTYGLKIKNSTADLIFDSRWDGIISCTSLNTFPSGVDVSISIDNTQPEGFGTTITKTTQSVTIPSTPGAFLVLTSLSGVKAFIKENTSGAGGEPVFAYGGGYFTPSLIQTGDTTLTATCVKTGPGTYPRPNTGGAGYQYTDTPYVGPFQVLRYVNF